MNISENITEYITEQTEYIPRYIYNKLISGRLTFGVKLTRRL